MKSTCMNCKYYKIDDEFSGYCRFVNKDEKNSPKNKKQLVRNDNVCDHWQDCGQQYYIRLGWLKTRKNTSNQT